MATPDKPLLAGAAFASILAAGSAGARESARRGGQDVCGKDTANTRFSPLRPIDSDNVGNLGPPAPSSSDRYVPTTTTLVVGDAVSVSTAWEPRHVCEPDADTGAIKGWVKGAPEGGAARASDLQH